jgi:cyclic pyranopterin phosphate synthase
MAMTDAHGRKINYLRLSITDRCNLRCRYCMPAEGVAKVGHRDVLSFEELERVAVAAVANGVEKIRVTGGEPLVRKGVVDFLARLRDIPGLRRLLLTTNGVLLPRMAADLAAAGVRRLNISLDSLRPETFRRITRIGEVGSVLAGIEAARAAGLGIKLNVVVMRGTNDHEIMDFVRFAVERALTVRFIEYMPVLGDASWTDLVVPGEEILASVRRQHVLAPLVRGRSAGPAREFHIAGTGARVGVITPNSGHFCGECNRIRVAATGLARACLFGNDDVDLRPLLAPGREEELRQAVAALIVGKPERHRLAEAGGITPFSMADIGG